VNIIIYTRRVNRYLEKNIIKDLENESLEFPIIGEFLADLKQKFGNRDDKSVKVAELKKIE